MEAIRERIHQALAARRLTGAVVAVTGRESTLWTEAFGDASADALFYIASSSKPIAAERAAGSRVPAATIGTGRAHHVHRHRYRHDIGQIRSC